MLCFFGLSFGGTGGTFVLFRILDTRVPYDNMYYSTKKYSCTPKGHIEYQSVRLMV